MASAESQKLKALGMISVIVPLYDEELNILPFYEVLGPVLSSLKSKSEIIFVDDGSRDSSYSMIVGLSAKDPRVRGIRFSRNFGSHAAILAGLRASQGDAAVVISVDLQDPPSLILQLLEKWKEGHEVVWAVREKRDDPFFKALFANLFYFILRKTALPNYPAGGMDFGLFDRKVIQALSEIQETNQFILGLISWLGFRQAYVPYHRQVRRRGISKWPFWKRTKSALDAMVSFSYLPIRFISCFGLFVSLISLLFAAVLIFNRIFLGMGASGWPSVMVAILFLGGVQLITLGILGEYIWRGTDQVKGRPQYVIMEEINFPKRGNCVP